MSYTCGVNCPKVEARDWKSVGVRVVKGMKKDRTSHPKRNMVIVGNDGRPSLVLKGGSLGQSIQIEDKRGRQKWVKVSRPVTVVPELYPYPQQTVEREN